MGKIDLPLKIQRHSLKHVSLTVVTIESTMRVFPFGRYLFRANCWWYQKQVHFEDHGDPCSADADDGDALRRFRAIVLPR